ncbi:hypothetical protein C3941_09455 [Kaistia algarum]|uniref:hypothetical protein n=1 Tax=Kaistia algarum TaxID=2083279 RepID=UPI000CE7D557|nr:hypothetical protein [Kaistia algarum]MCX5512284.1 hypothetical protein [Kaistia algarum]PPE80375.1 hypothetical protein C3941_09455 [Kaistia algarum]
MTKIVRFTEAEISEPADFEAIGEHAREGDEFITGGAVDYPHHWADFTIAQTSAIELTISKGRLFAVDAIFAADAPIELNLQVHLPLVTGDHRYIALLVRGESETVTNLRMIETDAETHETVQQAVPKTDRRTVSIVIQQGLSSPTPLKPTIAADQCCLAFVELSTTGIVAVEMDNASRVKSLYEVDGRLTQVEGDMANTIRRTTTMETDIANIASRLGDIPHPTIMRQLKRDVGLLRRQLALPDEARAYWYDAGLLQDGWDKVHATWLARVREGIRFAWAQERDMQLSLIDPSSASIRMSDTLLLPAWTEKTRISVEPDGGSKNISQLVHTVTTAVKKSISRQVTEYGETVTVCENQAEWSMLMNQSVGELFKRDGETFQVVAIVGNQDWAGHRIYAVRKVIVRTVTQVYWDYVTETMGVNGSVYGNTWLCSQPMILTSIDLNFTRIGSTGDVHVFVCECDDSGQPQFGAVIVEKTISAAGLHAGWVNFALRPSLLESGKRYAWFTVTTGNHALGTASGNKYAQGSLFSCSDGAWAMGDPLTDFAMRINAASFAATRTVIEFQPLTLTDGMTELRLLHGGWAPGGTSLVWYVQNSDDPDEEWVPLTLAAEGSDALAGRPALVRLRLALTGTTDLQAAIVLDANARGMTFRPRGDCQAVSKEQAFGLSTSTVQLEIVLDEFNPTYHTVAPKLVIGASILTPSATATTLDMVNPRKRTLLATFTLGSATTSARARVDMTTSDVTVCPFIQNIAMYAL